MAAEQERGSYLSSVVALGLGIVLAVGMARLFSVLGWGGELASQTAGAASGAAPLILDGVRHRRGRRSAAGDPPTVPSAPRRGLALPLLVAAGYGFAVLLVDTVVGLVLFKATQAAIRLAHGDQARFLRAYSLIGGVLTFPLVFAATALLAVLAGHRLGEHRRRWLLLGLAVYLVVRAGMLLASDPARPAGLTPGVLVASVALTMPILAGAALLGARRARRTQTIFDITSYFRRLPAEDQAAALALFDEVAQGQRRRRPSS